jgi:hypothetical protein
MPKSVILAPPPVFFIKSISEQGYTLSSAVADLIDNSVAAGATRVEILLDSHNLPLSLFIADNGSGMNAEELTANMRFPSADMDVARGPLDLGRFGLGLKTASFSQSRKFTVISRNAETDFEGRSWDVEFLKEDWALIIETPEDVKSLCTDFEAVSRNFHEHDENFELKTLVIWEQLYKLERLMRKNGIGDDLEELRSHLGLVFHRYISDGRLRIRLNNLLVEAFDPFPHLPGVQIISENFWQSGDDFIRFEGIILPKRAAAETREGLTDWAPAGRTLEEMQGIYIYRNGRLIRYGAWLKAISKSIYLQFGRIRIDAGNTADGDFQLNVAKSSLIIPFGLRRAMAEMVKTVAAQAAKEYRERIAAGVIRPAATPSGLSLITRVSGAAGAVLQINQEFELLRRMQQELQPAQLLLLSDFITLVEHKLNELWTGETNTAEINEGLSAAMKDKISRVNTYYQESDYSPEEIKDLLLDSFGRNNEVRNYIETLNTK